MAQPIAVSKSIRRAIESDAGLSNISTQEMYREILSRLGEDPDRDGLAQTPSRVEKSMAFLTKGYAEDPSKILRGAMFDVDYDEMVIVKDIEMFSLCEHHMLPFFGKVHVAYIPKGKVIGLSKIPRLVEVFRSASASAGAPHAPDRRHHSGSHQSAGSRRRHRGSSPLHDDARHREAELLDRHVSHGRLFPPEGNPRGISLARSPKQQRLPLSCETVKLWWVI